MIPYETTFEQEVALQSFISSLDTEKGKLNKASAELAQTIAGYRQAKKRFLALQALIQRMQGGNTDPSAESDTGETGGAEHVANANAANTTPAVSPNGVGFRDELVEIVKSGGFIKTTGKILASIRESRGVVPKSSVAGALSDLSEGGPLKRVRNVKLNTSYYGLPEWFNGDIPKPEHLPEQPLDSMPRTQA
ncbi:hypothetical protein SAMN00120144_3332 [Hymenobacter roseosalivarius DSM 11622]|uniref:Uncharacterized protein n=1 Tax=Hymenobacter roseosalivarius DSM 11622 TaxID=645990 RepID=A0A1W1VI15_9BACT|nr:hypothetical protein [Hymenobacter roseosalivarius]SMB92968.1 hypothetical protein SAMN00120144_3332 [Hymenobacter roseosalivarius DSM 11622]